VIGSGKTELAKILFGVDEKVNGSIFINEEKVDINSPYDAIKAGIGFLSEERKCNGLIPEMNVVENITLPNLKVIIKNGFIIRKKEKEIIINHLDKFKIKISSLDEAISNLNSGDQKKILISRWMFTDSKIIIFDEITRNIDIGAKSEIYNIINNLISNGITVIIISSDINEVLNLCDRIAVMCEGTITGILSSEEATQEKIVNLSDGL
jgi:ribose transport system ATP-binding protein